MAINPTDVSVAVNGDIRWTGGATPNYTVLELHRFLQGLADDAQASGDDLLDITSSTPSERSTDNIITLINGYNIDDTMSEHLYNGSITQDGGDTVYSGLQVLGAVNNTATQLMIMQDNDLYQFTTTDTAPFWGTQATGGYNGNAAAGILMQLCIKTRVNGADIDGQRVRLQARHWGDTYDFFNVTTGQGVSVAAIGTTPDAQNNTSQGTVTGYTDVLNSGGTANAPTGGYQTIDLNNGNGPQPYYSQWTFGARNLKALWEYTKDLTGNGTAKTVDGLPGELFLGITHDLNFSGQTTNFQEREIVVWGTKVFYNTLVSGPFTPGNYVTVGASGAAGRVMYDDGVDELVIALEDTSITILDTDVITEFPGPGAGATTTTAIVNTGGGATVNNADSGGSGLILAANDGGATGDLWIQLLTGSAPADTLPLYGVTSGGDGAVSGAPIARTIPKIFTGSFTGTYIGAFGIGIDSNDLTAADTIQDLLNATQTPPNNVTFTVSGLVASEDRVMVGPRLASVLNKAQLGLNGGLSSATTTAIVVDAPIPTGTPASGLTASNTRLRVQLDTGVFREQTYNSFSGSTFAIDSTDYSAGNVAANANDVFIAYIDKLITSGTELAYTAIYTTDVDLQVRVRDGGGTPIKTFEAPATFGASNTTVAAIRTTDA
jgi:hypothetical protein